MVLQNLTYQFEEQHLLDQFNEELQTRILDKLGMNARCNVIRACETVIVKEFEDATGTDLIQITSADDIERNLEAIADAISLNIDEDEEDEDRKNEEYQAELDEEEREDFLESEEGLGSHR